MSSLTGQERLGSQIFLFNYMGRNIVVNYWRVFVLFFCCSVLHMYAALIAQIILFVSQ